MGGYNQIFGGSAVYPSNLTYSAITLSSDITLSWPIESVSSEIIVADLIDFTPTTPGGWNVTLPDATGGSTGVTMIVSNLSGSFSFNLLDNTSNLVLSVDPGTVWLVYLTDNSTQAGVWRTFQYGAQAGSVNVAAIAGAGLLAIGSSLNQSMPVTGKSTNYTIVTDDRASVILWTGAGGTLTLPSAAAAQSNWFVNIRNSGSGDVVVSPPSGTIDGAASKTFTAGVSSAIVFTDGTNYYTLGYGSAATVGGFDYTTINCAGSDGVNGVITLAGGQLNRISYKCFGILTGNRTIVVPTTVQQYWINNQTTSSGGPWTLTIKTLTGGGQTISQPGQAIVYCDGTDVQPSTSGITLPVPISSGGTGSTTAPTALTALGGTATGVSLFTSSSAAVARGFLGAGAVGGNVFVAANASAALTAMAGGVMTGGFTVTTTFGATGTITGGGLVVTAATVVTNGMNLRGANSVGFRTNSVEAGYFDAAQNLVLTHALALAQGGTGATSFPSIANNLGDQAASANSLAQRNAGANLFANYFNAGGATENSSLGAVWTERSPVDGYNRRMTISDFMTRIRALFDVGNFVAANTGYEIFASGIMIQWGPTGNITAAPGDVTVNFGTPFPTACFAVYICETNTFVAGAAQAASRAIKLSASQFKVQNNSNGTQAFFYFAVGN